jgi:hypothetical protein
MTPRETASAAALLATQIRDAVQGAGAFTPELTGYLGVADGIDALLSDAQSGDDETATVAANRIAQLISSMPETRKWMRDLVETGQPPTTLRVYEGPIVEPLDPTLGIKFTCPNNDFTFYRRTVGTPVPACPHDGSALVRAS